MAGARARSRRALSMGMGSRRSTNGEKRAFFRARGDMVHGGGGGYPTLIDHVSKESNRERGSEVLSFTRWALKSDGRRLRKAPFKKKQA